MLHKGQSGYDYANCHEAHAWHAIENLNRQQTHSIDEPFRIMSAYELFQRPHPPEWYRRDIEERFRKGFYDGYDEALRHVVYLKAKGFLRVSEIANILFEFCESKLRKWWKMVWRDDITQYEFSYGNPRFKHESWWELRKQVFERDGNQCLCCESKTKLEADHIVPVCEGGLPELENLQTLCKTCHRPPGGKGES